MGGCLLMRRKEQERKSVFDQVKTGGVESKEGGATVRVELSAMLSVVQAL